MAIVAFVLMGAPAGAFVEFETGQVRPLAISPDGARLFVTNTPDNTLEIFDIIGGGLNRVASVPVGLEPLAVAARTSTEVWVVNHLSDSVSIVDLSDVNAAHVVRTLHVGDEPRDIVFAGADGNRAFITTAHRGQNTPLQANIDAALTTPGIGRADVWVFDAANLGSSLGGDELTILTLFADTPRALAVSPDGSTVYAAAFQSGNQTTTLSEGVVPDGGVANGGLPDPRADHLGRGQPEVGLIVKFNGSQWLDELNRDWSSAVRFSLPDKDVFAIDADANPPVQIAGPGGEYAHVGTTLFNMAVNPASGKIYVSNTEAFNEVRFEGPGTFTGRPTVRGHIVESRISVLDGAGGVTPVHLNKHIDYGTCCDADPVVNDKSLAFPLEMAVTSDGAMLYVAAFGSGKIGIFNTAELESDSFVPSAADHIEVTGGGPTGLVLDETRSQLYVLTRFDNSISIVGTGTGMETAHVSLHNPEPASVVNGRRFLYDARLTSSHGDQACASCHIFGDFDSLAWDLGNPDDTTLLNPGPIIPPFDNTQLFGNHDFRALKGPMTTQSLRGMDNHGPMHWRGDRTGGNDEPNAQPNSGAFNEDLAFKKFNPAFVGLVGRASQLTGEEMQSFTDFILEVMYPPNPIRNLDNSDTPDQAAARSRYFGPVSDTLKNCNGCHLLDPNGNRPFGVPRPGFFGTEGRYSFENETQFMKVAHLRNMYQKVGMFGMPAVPFFNAGNNGFQGPQVRGFGFLHDGSTDTVLRFFNALVFNRNANNPGGFATDAERRQMESFAHAFPTNHAPVVGQQITRTSTSGGAVDARITLMLARADANPTECDVVAKGVINGEARGAVYAGGGTWSTDRAGDAPVGDAALRAAANVAGQELTFTAVPVGEGVRIGVDRDLDGARDADELDGGSDPSNALSLPCSSPAAFSDKDRASIKDDKGQVSIKASMNLGTFERENVQVRIVDGGGVILDTGLPGTDLVLNGSGTTYQFKSKQAGLQRVSIKEDPKLPGTFKIKVKARDAWAPGAANETEATTTVSVNIGGQCLSGNATSVR